MDWILLIIIIAIIWGYAEKIEYERGAYYSESEEGENKNG